MRSDAVKGEHLCSIRMAQEVDGHEQQIAPDHQTEQLTEMLPYPLHCSLVPSVLRFFVFLHQTVATDEQEHRYAIMTEEREEMDEQVLVQCHHLLQHLHRLLGSERVFVLLHCKT